MDVLQSMSVFRRVVENGSFSAVARETGLSQPTVSKHIAALEQRLGTKLLSRSTRQLSLTDAGRRYYEQCVRIVDELAEVESGLIQEQSQLTGMLRINSPVTFGRMYILPHLWKFMRQYPELDIDLMMDDHYVDLVKEGVDVAIRLGPLPDANYIARKIGENTRVTVASPAYLRSWGMPKTPQDLCEHDCVVYSLLTTQNEWFFTGPNGKEKVTVAGRFSTNSPAAMREATLAGMGIGVTPVWLVADLLKTGKLRTVLDDYTPIPFEINAIYPERRFVSAKVYRFIEYLRTELDLPVKTQMENSR